MTVQRIALACFVVLVSHVFQTEILSAQTVRWGSPQVAMPQSPIVQVQHQTPITPPATPRVDMDVLAPELSTPSLRTTAPPTGATNDLALPTMQPTIPGEVMLDDALLQTPDAAVMVDTDRFGSERGRVGLVGKNFICPDQMGTKPIREISLDIRPKSIINGVVLNLPEECPVIISSDTERDFGQTCFQWTAAALCTKGSYFEDVQLERYGHSVCPALQPVISGTRFLLTVPLLPYKMGLTPPNECVYTLGHYRVGNCAPRQLDPIPISLRAILFEGAAIGGAVGLLP